MKYLIRFEDVFVRKAKNETWAKNRIAMQALSHFVTRRDAVILMEPDTPDYFMDELRGVCKANRNRLSFLKKIPDPQTGSVLISARYEELARWQENGGIPILFSCRFETSPQSMTTSLSCRNLFLSRNADGDIELSMGKISFPGNPWVIKNGQKSTRTKIVVKTNPDIVKFFETFKKRLVWDTVPLSFLYDLYEAWCLSMKLEPVSRTMFSIRIKDMARTDSIWDSSLSSNYLCLTDRLSKTEPLIREYGLARWMNGDLRPTYGSCLIRRAQGREKL